MSTLDPHALLFQADVHPEARAARRLTWDSREAGPEVAFVALPGETMHGNRFVQAALAAGAPFVLTDLDVPRAVRVPDAREALFAWARSERAKNALVVGITGSVGKTTAKNYAAAALQAAYMPVFNTLPAIACFLIEHGAGAAPLVVEMGIDRVGEMAELVGLVSPDVGIVTSIGAAHLEALGTVENVAREKGLILKAPRALVGAQAASFYPGVTSYGFEHNDFAGEEPAPGCRGRELRVSGRAGDAAARRPRAGRGRAAGTGAGAECRAGVAGRRRAYGERRAAGWTLPGAAGGLHRHRRHLQRLAPEHVRRARRPGRPTPRQTVDGESACWGACWNSGPMSGACTPTWASTRANAPI